MKRSRFLGESSRIFDNLQKRKDGCITSLLIGGGKYNVFTALEKFLHYVVLLLNVRAFFFRTEHTIESVS